jgi:hypothetical protein
MSSPRLIDPTRRTPSRRPRILVVVDGSAAAWRAFDLALTVSRETSPMIRVAIPGLRVPRGAASIGEVEDVVRSSRARTRGIAAHAAELAEMHEIDMSVLVIPGSGVRTIIRTVESERPLTLVLPRKRGICRLLRLPDRADRIARRVECRVLVAD